MGVTLALSGSSEQQPDHGYRCADCNVILISIDTLRADHLGCYGYGPNTSPNIDEFSTDAVLFSTTIAQASSTEPSHASIFTSRIPAHHGAMRALRLPISPDVVTLPEVMQKAGYRTISYNGGGQVSAHYGFGRGFEVYDSTRGENRFTEKVDAAIDWLENNAGEKFFFFLHSYEVHAPYKPPAEYIELMGGTTTGPAGPRIDREFMKTTVQSGFAYSITSILE